MKERFVTRFNKEALAAAGLNHPGIVAVYDSGQEETASGAMPYIVMEYVQGHTLREILHKGERLAFERALEIVSGVLDALAYSHKNGIVHRDIKPGNIMITSTGEALGCWRHTHEHLEHCGYRSIFISRTGNWWTSRCPK